MWRLAAMPGTPHQVALGAAVGIAVAFTPTAGVQMLLAGALARAVSGSVRAALPMVWISNPLTAAPILLITYETGRLFWPWAPGLGETPLLDPAGSWSSSPEQWLALGGRLLMPLILGGCIVGLLLGLASYPLVRLLVQRRRAITEGC